MFISLIHSSVLAIAASSVNFRPPAIPLLTADPFMQTWMRGDNSTSEQVSHWYGAEMQMIGYIRIDGEPYQYLGSCVKELVDEPGLAERSPNKTIAQGSCEISGGEFSEAECNIRCYNNAACKAFVLDGGHCYLKSCSEPLVPSASATAFVITGTRPTCTQQDMVVQQKAVTVFPTRTVFEFLVADGAISFNLTFLSTMFTDNYTQLSRPVYYVDSDVASLDGNEHVVELYFDMSAQHVVNDCQNQQVQWSSWESGEDMEGVQIGNANQSYLGTKGDRVNIDWGSLHLGVSSTLQTSVWAGSAKQARSIFKQKGKLPESDDTRQPRSCEDDLPALAAVADLGTVTSSRHQTFVIAYDEVYAIDYFGEKYRAYWTQAYGDIQEAMVEATKDHDEMLNKSKHVDDDLLTKAAEYGDKYAALVALSYRQTLASTKLVWNSNRSMIWNFLKEISTNGDMQTMDVIYPASPMFLYTNPDLLKFLLEPILAYANNETDVGFSQPYSPHQLGTYPVGDATTQAQENMPLENTGNMFLMLLGIARREQDPNSNSWFYPKYWPMLQNWADELARTAQFPANQLCTDDFEGALPNNTNLGAKGIVALEAFAELCRLAGATNCSHYSEIATKYAKTWQDYAFTSTPQPHYKLSYNNLSNVSDSWSLKYNLLWQKMLELEGPFPWDKIISTEMAYYKTKANKFGVPMDPRHVYVKSDWLSWIAAMAQTTADFKFLIEPVFDALNATANRSPFTDLYHTDTAAQDRLGFIARPVVGGIFAKMLMPSVALAPPPQCYSANVTSFVNDPVISAYGGGSDFAQNFNPSWIEPSFGTKGRAGLLIRSQNCTSCGLNGTCCFCSGIGAASSVLTFAELLNKNDTADAVPRFAYISNESVVFGPHAPIDVKGTEDPRVAFDNKTGEYHVLYTCLGTESNATPTLCHAVTPDPTSSANWSRLGPMGFGQNSKSGAMLIRESAPHFLYWGAGHIRVTQSDDLYSWKPGKSFITKTLFGHSNVEAGPPPMKLSTGDYVFFINSWSDNPSDPDWYQPSWVILNGSDPTQIIAQATEPLISPSQAPWMEGSPPYQCNVKNVAFLEAAHPIAPDTFRVFFGGADAVIGTAVVEIQPNGVCGTALVEQTSQQKLPTHLLRRETRKDVVGLVRSHLPRLFSQVVMRHDNFMFDSLLQHQ